MFLKYIILELFSFFIPEIGVSLHLLQLLHFQLTGSPSIPYISLVAVLVKDTATVGIHRTSRVHINPLFPVYVFSLVNI